MSVVAAGSSVPVGERQPDDADLVEAARLGDRAAFAVLVERHRSIAIGLAGGVLENRHIVVDVVQEATVTAMVGLDRLRTPAKFGPWFAGIALNVARRWWRDARHACVASNEPRDLPVGPEELAVQADLADRIRAAVERLPRGQRDAVFAFYWKGLSHADAAAELGVSPGAVKARLHQARASLAPSLASYVARRTPRSEGAVDRATARFHHTRKESQMSQAVSPSDSRDWISVDVDEVHRSRDDDEPLDFHAVVLRECTGERRAAIYIGAAEATALAFSLETVEMPRPMTYEMTSRLVRAAGARVAEVRITHLSGRTVFAVVGVETAAGLREVDARPSDALNLALVTGVPLLVESKAFEALASCSLRDWQQYPDRARDLVSEAQERQSRAMSLATAAMERQRATPPESAESPGGWPTAAPSAR